MQCIGRIRATLDKTAMSDPLPGDQDHRLEYRPIRRITIGKGWASHMHAVRLRFWLEAVLGAASFILMIITLISHDWIEILFGIDPDGGNGTLEWAIVGVLAVCALATGGLAHREWRRAAIANQGT